MIIYKYTNAFEQIETFSQDNWDVLGDLVKYTIDSGKKEYLDDIANEAYPEGCSEEEFKKWVLSKSKVILKALKKRGL